MKQLIGIVLCLLLVACSGGLGDDFAENEAVRLFTAMAGTLEFAEKRFSGEDASMIADLVAAECPDGVTEPFVRAVYSRGDTRLILYASDDGQTVYCSLFKLGDASIAESRSASDAPSEGVAMTVNGVPVTIDQVNAALAAVPQTSDQEGTLNTVLNNLINTELLRQEAAKIAVSSEEVEEQRSLLVEQAGITDFSAWLATNGLSEEDFREIAEQQAQMQQLLSDRLLADEIIINESFVRDYYVVNTNQFLQSEQAVMRHIFISTEGRSAEQVEARAQQVAELLDDQDFCQLVAEFSDDNERECGVYIVPRGVIQPDLEYASFNTPVNSTSVVRTDGGVHFVQTLQVTPAQIVPYQQVAESLQAQLRNSVLQERLNLFLSMLRAESEIVLYLQ